MWNSHCEFEKWKKSREKNRINSSISDSLKSLGFYVLGWKECTMTAEDILELRNLFDVNYALHKLWLLGFAKSAGIFLGKCLINIIDDCFARIARKCDCKRCTQIGFHGIKEQSMQATGSEQHAIHQQIDFIMSPNWKRRSVANDISLRCNSVLIRLLAAWIKCSMKPIKFRFQMRNDENEEVCRPQCSSSCAFFLTLSLRCFYQHRLLQTVHFNYKLSASACLLWTVAAAVTAECAHKLLINAMSWKTTTISFVASR